MAVWFQHFQNKHFQGKIKCLDWSHFPSQQAFETFKIVATKYKRGTSVFWFVLGVIQKPVLDILSQNCQMFTTVTGHFVCQSDALFVHGAFLSRNSWCPMWTRVNVYNQNLMHCVFEQRWLMFFRTYTVTVHAQAPCSERCIWASTTILHVNCITSKKKTLALRP